MYILISTLIALFAGKYFIDKYKSKKIQQSVDQVVPDSFIVFDLETTGLNADIHEIIELAALRYEKGTNQFQFLQALVKPKNSIPKNITNITGITQKMVDADGSPIEEVLTDFRNFAGDLRLVTFNSDFDMAFLQAAAQRANQPIFDNPVSCALKMARRAWPKRKSFKLVDLARDGEFNKGKAHRALEDAERALIVYCAAASELGTVA